jgi:ElaB/YqjD/DUF883 family membrane-anchored ribosome-binding protein
MQQDIERTLGTTTTEESRGGAYGSHGMGESSGQVGESAGQEANKAMEEGAERLGQVLDAAQRKVENVAERAPEVIETSVRQIRTSPTPSLMLGTVFSAGLGIGLLVARAPRPLVALALGPALVMGATLMGRRQGELVEW